MIARARADHHEREAVLGGDAGHQGLRAVASGDAEQIGTFVDGIAGYLGDVDGLGAADEEHLGAEVFGLALQVELLDLPAAGLRVHDQVRVPGRRLGRVLGHAPVRLIPGQRPPRGHARDQPDRGRQDRDPQQVPERVDDDHRDRRQDEDRKRQPAPDAPPGQEDVRGGQADDRGGHAHGHHGQALQPGHDHQDHDRQACEREAEARQPALRARALGNRPRRHGWHRQITLPSSRGMQLGWRRRSEISDLSMSPSWRAGSPGPSPSQGDCAASPVSVRWAATGRRLGR